MYPKEGCHQGTSNAKANAGIEAAEERLSAIVSRQVDRVPRTAPFFSH